jgi:hypothetical protein
MWNRQSYAVSLVSTTLKFSAYSSLTLNCFFFTNLFCVITSLHAYEIYGSLNICLEMLMKNTAEQNIP